MINAPPIDGALRFLPIRREPPRLAPLLQANARNSRSFVRSPKIRNRPMQYRQSALFRMLRYSPEGNRKMQRALLSRAEPSFRFPSTPA